MLELAWLIYLVGAALIIAAILDLMLSCSNIGTHLYVYASEVKARDLARQVLSRFREAIDQFLGARLFSRKSVLRVSIVSIILNTAIVAVFIAYIVVFDSTFASEPHSVSNAPQSQPEVKPMSWLLLVLAVVMCILPFLSFALFDNLSVMVTRKLLAKACKAKSMLPSLLFDSIFALGLVWLQVVASLVCTVLAINGMMILIGSVSSDFDVDASELLPIKDTLNLAVLGPQTVYYSLSGPTAMPEIKIVFGLFLFGASNLIITMGYLTALLFSALFHGLVRPSSTALSKTLEVIDKMPNHFLTKLTVVFGAIITFAQLP